MVIILITVAEADWLCLNRVDTFLFRALIVKLQAIDYRMGDRWSVQPEERKAMMTISPW